MRTILLWLSTVLIFVVFAGLILQKQALRNQGSTVYLPLAPVDPRSLMQGDYMELRYQAINDLARLESGKTDVPASGRLVLRLDANRVGTFVRLDEGTPLAPNEVRLTYQQAHGHYRLGTENFFIPEGRGQDFADAKYGELKVGTDGAVMLVGLCDAKRRRLEAGNRP